MKEPKANNPFEGGQGQFKGIQEGHPCCKGCGMLFGHDAKGVPYLAKEVKQSGVCFECLKDAIGRENRKRQRAGLELLRLEA